jgi:predicted nucleic acid-binding protein
MILVDTSVWIDHLSNLTNPAPEMRRQLVNANIAMHPFIAAELALGSLRDRTGTLALLDKMPQVRVAQLAEVRRMVEVHSLYGRGIGLTDAHLLASTLITPFTQIWTRDKRLRLVAEGLGIHAPLPLPEVW